MFKIKLMLFLCLALQQLDFYGQSGRIPVEASNGMVVSSHYLGSETGVAILQMGGNAIDASIATAFTLAVTLPSAGNIGGGGFLLYKPVNAESTAFNFREKAPEKATKTMFLGEDGKVKDNSNHETSLSAGVPGTVAGLYQAHSNAGKLDWATLVQPAIDLAKNGFAVYPDLARFSRWVYENKEEYASTAAVFLNDEGEAYSTGDTIVQKDLAASLTRIRDYGAEGFYKGKTAQLIEDFMRSTNGIITKKDLENYESAEVQPLRGSYRGYGIIGMPPPSSGGTAVIEMLNILENYDLQEYGLHSAQSIHLISEAMRRAFADRAQFLGDPEFNPEMPLDTLLSKSYAHRLQASVIEKQASVSDSSNFNKKHLQYESEETTHISVVDKEGNAVSLTYTLEHSYGNRIVVEGAGFLLNNEMGDFNAIPGLTNSEGRIGTVPNQIAPGKRMLSSMSPTIVTLNDKAYLVIGSPGGRTIINTVLQVILNVVDYELDIAKAIESPKFHHQWLPDVITFEEWGFSPDTIAILKSYGHETGTRSSQGRAMGIIIDPESGAYYGAADSRSYMGQAVGY
ncbi:gamma-glutamyltransferase [Christiangramia portivictoriae]|uniref:gamma-glutamyltransferase n=1 Tax=Christiangramia portivictoriae TaxID=326069 RepID=UPI0004263F49|nr:gamma-glutamyltransferase [Christiangramia portivictoriae]